MGKYDDITPEQLRKDLVAFAELLLRMDREDDLLRSAADLQRLIGDLRQKLFAYEVRCSHRLLEPGSAEGRHAASEEGGPSEEDPVVRDSLRVIAEALRREEEMRREWEGTHSPEEDEDDD